MKKRTFVRKSYMFYCFFMSLVVSIMFCLTGCTKQRETPERTQSDQVNAKPRTNLSKLHRSMIGHWVEYTQHMHAYISPDAIVLKREDGDRLESYIYRVYSEDEFLSTLLLKVKHPGDVSEQSWEAQCLDYGAGMKLTIGRAHFSYVGSQIKP